MDLNQIHEVEYILPQLVCYGSTDEGEKPVRERLNAAFISFGMSATPTRVEIQLALMKISAAHGDRGIAALEGKFASFLQRQWDGHPLAEEEPIYWDMLSPDMQNILLAHGGTRLENVDARPDDWKSVDATKKQELWVYKSGGAVVTTYIFTDGKLTQTLKP